MLFDDDEARNEQESRLDPQELLRSIANPVPLAPFQPYESYRHALGRDNDQMFFGLAEFSARDAFIENYGFVLVTQEVLSSLCELLRGRRVLDAGCGSGYLAHALGQRGIDVLAVDHCDYRQSEDAASFPMRQVWRLDLQADAVSLLPGDFDAVMLSWPDYSSSFGTRVLEAMRPGQLLVYQGEGRGGCTADDAFHSALFDTLRWAVCREESQALNTRHFQFLAVHDRWHVYRCR